MKFIVVSFAIIIVSSCLIITNGERGYRRRLRPLAPQTCNVSRNEALNALQALFLVGDPDMILPEDHCHILEHCDRIEEQGRKKLEHLECVTGKVAKKVYTALANAWLRENQKRCSTKKWRERFLKFSDCVRTGSAASDIHQCGYKLHEVFKYAVDNYEVRDQLPLGCCGIQLMEGCISEKLNADCDEETAKFGPQMFWEPVVEAFELSCPGLENLSKCRKYYPSEMRHFGKIFKSRKKLTPRNFMIYGFQLHLNREHKMPEHPEYAK